jgi:hypothetical protein
MAELESSRSSTRAHATRRSPPSLPSQSRRVGGASRSTQIEAKIVENADLDAICPCRLSGDLLELERREMSTRLCPLWIHGRAARASALTKIPHRFERPSLSIAPPCRTVQLVASIRGSSNVIIHLYTCAKKIKAKASFACHSDYYSR